MVTHFITVSNGIITGQHCGDIKADFSETPYHGHKRIVIPGNVMVSASDKLEYYDKDWRRIPDGQLINNGLMPMPSGHKIVGGELVPMSQVERINAGLEELPTGFKIADGDLVPMTQVERINAGQEELPVGFKIADGELVQISQEEQLAAGQITQEEYNQHLANENTAELRRRLAELQTPEILAEAELDEEFAAERKAKLAALLAVKQQDGWPLVVVWPEE
jgi:hypothetical protein